MKSLLTGILHTVDKDLLIHFYKFDHILRSITQVVNKDNLRIFLLLIF